MAKKKRVYVFVDEKGGAEFTKSKLAYSFFRAWLLLFVDADIFTDIRPFQLGYRSFDVYLIDVGGYPEVSQIPYMANMGDLVRGRGSRLFLFWGQETWDAFCKVNPDLRGHSNCVNCSDSNARERIEKILLDMDSQV